MQQASVYTEKTYQVKSLITKEAFFYDNCQTQFVNAKEGYELRINISDWFNVINKEFLEYCANGYSIIYLTIKNAEVLPVELLDDISNVFQDRLVGIELDNCNNCAWNREIKKLLTKSNNIKSLVFKNLKWIDDLVMEQIAKRFKDTLEHIELVKCMSISNNGLFQLGRACSKIRKFTLSCCPRISDVGMLEMTKKIRITNLQFSHNMHITDKSMDELIAQMREINPVEFINMPKLTDKTISYLYEIVRSNGKHRTAGAANITSILFQDMPQLTGQCALFLTTATQALVTVDIRDCPSMDMSTMIVELSNMRTIRHLILGNNPQMTFNVNYFLKGMVKLIPQLISLTLLDFTAIFDEQISELIDICDILTEVTFQNMPIGTQTIESICSYLPNIKKVNITGSLKLLDIDMRCLASVCLHLNTLTIQSCPRITDAAFTRCVILRYVHHLVIGMNSKECTSNTVRFFNISPLQTITLKGIVLDDVSVFRNMKSTTRAGLTKCSLQDCQITIDVISFVLDQFVACKHIDLSNAIILNDPALLNTNNTAMTDTGKGKKKGKSSTGTPVPAVTSTVSRNVSALTSLTLPVLIHTNPFLRYQATTDAQGFCLTIDTEKAYNQYWSCYRQYERHIKATWIQRCRRRYLQQIQDNKIIRREEWKLVKQYLLIKLQAKIRKFVAYRKTKRKLLAGRTIVKYALEFLHARDLKKATNAILHYKATLQKKTWFRFRDKAKEYIKDTKRKSKMIVQQHHYILKRQVFAKLNEISVEIRELLFAKTAKILWEIKFLTKVLHSWRTCIRSTIQYHMKLNRIFLNTIPLTHLNSTRQKGYVQIAQQFHRKRLLSLAWLCLAFNRLEKLRVDRLIPMAMQHAKDTFFRRVVGACFRAIEWYFRKRRYMKERKAFGEKSRLVILKHKWFVKYPIYFLPKSIERKSIERSLPIRAKYLKKLAIQQRWKPRTFLRIFLKSLMPKVLQHHEDFIFLHGYIRLKEGIIEQRDWREKIAKAKMLLHKHFSYYPFIAWKKHTQFWLTIDERVINQYRNLLKARGFKKIRYASLERRGVAKIYLEQLKNAAGNDPKRMLQLFTSIIKFQAAVRSKISQKRFQEQKINELYSVQTLQNFFRIFLARKNFMSRLKKRDITETIREDHEVDLMRDAEAETRYFMYKEHALITIQRFYRGYRGRIYAFEAAVEHFRRMNLEFYQENEHFRVHHEAYMRALQAKEQIKHRAALEIQRVYRGARVRASVKSLQYQYKVSKHAVFVQRAYKKRLARLRFFALKRDLIVELRHNAARHQRGTLMRSFGFATKKIQASMTPILEGMGLDPMSFNYRIHELINDTVQDYHFLKNALEREYQLFKEFGWSPFNRMIARRKIFNGGGWKFQLHDAVRIIEAGHRYEGYTGIIVRIDEKLLGIPLYEVRLDHFENNIQTYVRMSTDAMIAYEKVLPLAKIRKSPPLTDLFNERYKPIFGLNPQDPFYAKKNVYAAWKIQRSFRQYRARNIVARMRYELWRQNVARNNALLQTLSETNSMTMQAHFLAGSMHIRSHRPIHYDEIRHHIQPGRYFSQAIKPNEKRVIKKEYDGKYKDRLTYLQKNSLLNQSKPRDYFSLGFEAMTRTRKVKLLAALTYGFVKNSGKGIQSLLTANMSGVKSLLQQHQTSFVTGTDNFCFREFQKSSHVRYFKSSVYQGEWSGVPLITSLKPHGEGLVTFLDGWGFAKEDKVLYLTILRCRHLNAMDFGTATSDPYCEIQCNGIVLQTSIQWENLNPEFHESFEIDVTNPLAELFIVVKDKDIIGNDDFMGQIAVPLSKYENGREHFEKILLGGEDPKVLEDFDRGEIEFRIRWAERIFEEDQIRLDYKKKMLVRIQSWSRRIAAHLLRKKLKKEYKDNMEMVRKAATKITNTCRIRLARKEFRRRFRRLKASIKIQKRVRIWRARRQVQYRKRRHYAAIKIQRMLRITIAKAYVNRLREHIKSLVATRVTLIQKNIRRFLAMKWYQKQLFEKEKAKGKRRPKSATIEDATTEKDGSPKKKKNDEKETKRKDKEREEKNKGKDRKSGKKSGKADEIDEDDEEVDEDKPRPVSTWIGWYGIDPEYYLKRNRRITERLFRKLLRMKYVRLMSRFGVVYVDSYPPQKTEEELVQELQGNTDASKPPLTNREDFVSVFFPSFRPVGTHLAKAKDLFHKHGHTAILHIPTSIYVRESVDYNIKTIQCFQRQRTAKQQRMKLLRVHNAIRKFQKHFRRRYERFHKASMRITSLFRMIYAMKSVKVLLRERRAAVKLQCGYRCYLARRHLFAFHSIAEVSVLKATTGLEYHGAEKCLEHRMDTFWIADSPDKAEIRVEFLKIEYVVQVWIQTSTYSASPQYVSIYTLKNKQDGYIELWENFEMELTKGDRWFRFDVKEPLMTKYFKVIFHKNYGDPNNIAVRQIRFIRSKERSATIVEQPSHYILNPGPRVADEGDVTLEVKASGYPLPTFQWYRNGTIVEGATEAKLSLRLYCAAQGERTYRCIRCKMMALNVPFNAYHIQCANCSYLFTYKEVEDFDHLINKIKEDEEDLNRRKTGLLTSKMQMQNFENEKHKSILQDLDEQIQAIELQLSKLREVRYNKKMDAPTVNHFDNEGVYYCMVQNIRGGAMKMRQKTNITIVLIEKPSPFLVDVIPHYVPRQPGKRKKWNIYQSIYGTFRKGRLEGLVLIRYNDGSFYEGPYVSEDSIDNYGQSIPSVKIANHYGRYTTPDGRCFEGFNVDNHFDVNNLQLFYRLFFPNGECYEGHFCDEQFHGIGMFKYQDGSVYEGQWHRGNRFGHGHLRSSEGWTYEGFFDRDRRHRQGVITFTDGSCYMGDWFYDAIKGKGIYVTALRDVYKGELADGKYDGYGELVYADGCRYTGYFKNHVRCGPGIFIDTDGTEYYGNYIDDHKIGEFIVKVVIPIEEKGQDNYEIRIGLYDEATGELVKWKLKFSHPIATKQFISLFRKSREMFDSVYSMILAKHLPNLPEGIDANNPHVKQIIFKIRTEAGMLVGQQALQHAQQQLQNLMEPMKQQEILVEQVKKDIEKLSLHLIHLEREANDFHYKFVNRIAKYEKDTAKIEQFWMEDPKKLRIKFQKLCKKLHTLSVDDYFGFRNHRVVPPFVRKIVDAICYLMDIPTDDWMKQVLIISDAIANARNGDEEALRLTYHCKLAFFMDNGYDVFKFVKIKELEKLRKILADVRFRSDSFYVESTGPAGPILVDWIKANYYYVREANKMYETLLIADEKRTEAYRCKASHQKKKEEINEATAKLISLRDKLKAEQLTLADLQHAVLKANDLLSFISGRFQFGNDIRRQDYYKLLEEKLEKQRDFFNIEVCARFMVDTVVEKHDKEQAKLKMQCYLKNEEYKEPILPQVSLMKWIEEEVAAQQTDILAGGRTLRYPLLPDDYAPTDITADYTMQIICLIVDVIIGKMNDYYNDLASCRAWMSMKGRKFNSRFLYIHTWKVWEAKGMAIRDAQAMIAWESIFGDEEACAAMAVEARISIRMSAMARAQGTIWAKHHPAAVLEAERRLAEEFASSYTEYEDLCNTVIQIDQDPEQNLINEFPPAIRARCLCWMKFNADETTRLRDQVHLQYSEQFAAQFPSETGEIAYKILNALTQNEEELAWYQYAVHWKEFNLDKFDDAGMAIMQEMARDFIEQFPLSTFLESTKIIVHQQMLQYLPGPYISQFSHEFQFEEVVEELNTNQKYYFHASAWAMSNQGMLRKGKDIYRGTLEEKCNRFWTDILEQTDQLQKGSALYVVGDPIKDRFHGFRIRLINKYIWVYLLAVYEYYETMKSIREADLDDPIKKVLHRIRPSNEMQHREEVEKNFMESRAQMEKHLQEVTDRLMQWNTFFGWAAIE